MEENKQNYLFAKEVLEAVSDADRQDETAQMGRLLSVEELEKIKAFVRLCENQGIHLLIRSIN